MSMHLDSNIRARAWLLCAVIVSLVPFAEGFSLTNVFHIRDLGIYFWPRHLSLHDAWQAGEWPLWNSYIGAGQSAIADPLNQFFLLPVTLIRLLLPKVAGFNFWVAAPSPVLAVGAWFWLRRYASPFGAAVAAAVFAAAGPVVSSADFPNFSWSIAFIPWALWATNWLCERPAPAPLATLAAIVAMQAVAGEVVTFAGTCGLLAATAMFIAPGELGFKRARRVVAVGIAVVAGVLLSAVQTVPLMLAAGQSTRDLMPNPFYWSVHPLALAELAFSHLYGHPHSGLEGQPWLGALNDGTQPLLYSLYVGIGALSLSLIARADREDSRWRRFWSVVIVISTICALGDFTPVYPAAQRVVPLLRSFRFPIKYLVFAIVGVVALLSTSVDALKAHVDGHRPMRRPTAALSIVALVGLAAAILFASNLLERTATRGVWEATARALSSDKPSDAAAWMMATSTSQWLRAIALAGGLLVLLLTAWRRDRFGTFAVYAFCAVAVLDPLFANSDLNPAIAAADLGPPAWVKGLGGAATDRVYVGGFIPRRRVNPTEPMRMLDSATKYDLPIDAERMTATTRLWTQFAYTPAPWRVRQVISFDLPQLWPRDYSTMIDVFRRVSREDRLRFVARTGARYCFLSEPPAEGVTPVVPASELSAPMALYECGTEPRRVFVTATSAVEPSLRRQVELMFDAAHDPFRQVLLEREPPPPAGEQRAPAAQPSAHIVAEHTNDLLVAASVGAGGGYLNVFDSFDQDWQVTVDGAPASLLRADGVFRAVRLTAGQHEVRFAYRPRALVIGSTVTGVTGLALLFPTCGAPLLARTRRRVRVDSISRAPYDALHEYQ